MKDNKKSSRREFLKGKSALDAVRADANSHEISVPHGTDHQYSSKRAASYVEQYAKNAMACEFEIMFNMHQYRQSGVAAMAAFQLIDALEAQMTAYQTDSEVSLICQNAFASDVAVESRLFNLLLLSRRLFEETGGAFDITSEPLSKIWGFNKRSGSLPDELVIKKTLESVGMSQVRLMEDSTTIRFTSRNVGINLNGIGKGYALDRVAELFQSRGIDNYIVHGGQSSVVARGTSVASTQTGEPEEAAEGWSIGVSHPTLPGVRLGEILLRDQALGTSGTARQGFFHNGKRYGHVIDPRTGWPSTHLLSSTVISDSAAQSDALATAFFVMTIDEVTEYCDSHPEVGAVLVEANQKKKSQVSVHLLNVDEGVWVASN